jgi:cyclopropane-fatty-acyl-phospholipid synthase
MEDRTMTANAVALAAPAPSPADRVFRRLLLARLADLEGGLVIEDAEVRSELGSGTPAAHVTVNRSRFYRRTIALGSVGAAESYVDGDWDCDDLVGLVRLLVVNRALTERLEGGLARVGAVAAKLVHRLLRDNTETGSRANIAAHYDLGNDLFEAFLDSRMQYSSAWFESGADLERASLAKLDRVVAKLNLTSADHLLEIGGGWGGLAIHAAKASGCRVTTTTISQEQYSYAVAQVAAAGLGDRVRVLCEDYRRLAGRYSKIVSVEMVEAVGANWLDRYFETIDGLLEDDGIALLQAITIDERNYSGALKSVDFIKRHIFPGSFIPAVSVLVGSAARSGLATVNLEDLGFDYALTLQAWRERFEAAYPHLEKFGYDEHFRRLWRFYLAYCEGGFRERALSDVQLLLAKPGYRGRPHRASA